MASTGRGGPSPYETIRTLEAFNIDPYLQWVQRKSDEASATRQDEVPRSLEELKAMIRDAISHLKENAASESDMPSFSFHLGANVLVVTGTNRL
jgi:hypothetical protein